MASYKGCKGRIKIDGNTISEVRDWNLEETIEILDASSMNSCDKVKKAGMKDGTGSINCLWDDLDTLGQGSAVVGAEVELTLFPKGDSAGDTVVTFDAIISSVGVSASFDGLVEKPVSFESTGGIVWGTVQ
jgi:hypothetical protein